MTYDLSEKLMPSKGGVGYHGCGEYIAAVQGGQVVGLLALFEYDSPIEAEAAKALAAKHPDAKICAGDGSCWQFSDTRFVEVAATYDAKSIDW